MRKVSSNISFQDKHHSFDMKLLLDVDQVTQRLIFNSLEKKEFFEPELFHLIMRVLKRGDRLVDVGAHVGFFTILAAHKVGPAGKVISIEPIEENQTCLEHQIQLNELENIVLLKGVVADADVAGSIFFNSDNDGGHALWDPGLHPFNEKSKDNKIEISVPSRKLSSLTEWRKTTSATPKS